MQICPDVYMTHDLQLLQWGIFGCIALSISLESGKRILKRFGMKRILALCMLLVVALPTLGVEGEQVMYVGGTIKTLKEGIWAGWIRRRKPL
jgi:hypothetical protein